MTDIQKTTYMIVEHFRNGEAAPVYSRFRERGRMAPAGLTYVMSWVSADFSRCYQALEAPQSALPDESMPNCSDLVDFEVVPVITSKEAAERFAP